MRRQRHRRRQVTETDLTPMLDIVFIMLIFFIVTSNFIREEVIVVEVPNQSPPAGPAEPAIIVAVDDRDLVRVNGRLTNLASVRSGIERVKAERPDAPLIIQASRKSCSGAVVNIRDAAYEAGFDSRVAVMLTDPS